MQNEYIEFEKGTKYPIKDGDVSYTPDTFQDCGYILKDDEVVVDIDTLSHDKIKSMISMFNIKTQIVWTDRGAHLYFRKPQRFNRKERICALGFNIEYKHSKNTKAITIKRNGKLREIENENVREPLPNFFEDKGKYVELIGLSEGEGRNQALYAHKMQLNNMTGWNTILSFINNFIFDEPLDPKEFEEVSRQEIINKKENMENVIADGLLRELKMLSYGGRYYFKESKDGEFIDDESILKKIVYKRCDDVKTTFVDEVIKQMKYKCDVIPNDTVFKIKFNNGYLYEGEFVPIIIDEFTPYNIPIDYKIDAEPIKVVDDYLNHLTGGDEIYKDLLLEVLGHTLIVNPEFKRLLAKFFIFIGSGGNGKGTLLQIIKSILGTKNVTGMNIKELSDERYLSTFKGKLANLGDDIQDQAINDKDMKVLKNISTCDYISSRELYKQAESMYFTGSLIFTSNHLIKSFEKGKSYKRRVLWLPMYTVVKEEDKDPLFITNLTTRGSLEYWIRLIVEGYFRLYNNNQFTKSDKVDDFNKVYHEENNPYLMYLQDMEAEDFIDIPVKDVNQKVKEWCDENDEEFKQKMFIETLKELFNIDNSGQKKINGKNTKVYKKLD